MTGTAEPSMTKRGLALLLALRSLRRLGTDAPPASVPGEEISNQILSGTLTVNPDWTVGLVVNLHNRSGKVVKEHTFAGVLVSKEGRVDVQFGSNPE